MIIPSISNNFPYLKMKLFDQRWFLTKL